MARYFLDLFTPETWAKFRAGGEGITGFRERQHGIAQQIKPGDIFLCYLTRLSRWCGVLRVNSSPFIDDTPYFADATDPFVVRFKVEPVIVLDPERSIPIFEDSVWQVLSETKSYPKGGSKWTGRFRSSLTEMTQEDGDFLSALLKQQANTKTSYEFTDRDKRQLARKQIVATPSGDVIVEVPEEDEPDAAPTAPPAIGSTQIEVRKSIEMQAKIAQIGAAMGFKIWIPAGDRGKVLEIVPSNLKGSFLDNLSLNYESTTLDTIRQIDVLWLNHNAMTRAFEVEHTTAVYSGLLRMADLFALQPNMKIKAHIVAPEDRREKVLKEIRRPVFSMLSSGPLYESCTFLAYDAIDEVASNPHLEDLKHTILDKFAESAVEEA